MMEAVLSPPVGGTSTPQQQDVQPFAGLGGPYVRQHENTSDCRLFIDNIDITRIDDLQSNKPEYRALLTSNLATNLHRVIQIRVPSALLSLTTLTENSNTISYTSFFRPTPPTHFPTPHSSDRQLQHSFLSLTPQTDTSNTSPSPLIPKPTSPTHFPKSHSSDRHLQHPFLPLTPQTDTTNTPPLSLTPQTDTSNTLPFSSILRPTQTIPFPYPSLLRPTPPTPFA